MPPTKRRRNITITDETWALAEKLAEKESRSVSSLIEHLIKQQSQPEKGKRRKA